MAPKRLGRYYLNISDLQKYTDLQFVGLIRSLSGHLVELGFNFFRLIRQMARIVSP